MDSVLNVSITKVENASCKLEGITECHAVLSGPPLLPLPEKEVHLDSTMTTTERDRARLKEASGVMCRLSGQLAYWILAEELPFEETDPNHLQDLHHARHLRYAEKSSKLATGLSSSVRSEEGGAPLLPFNVLNLQRVKSLLTRGLQLIAQIPPLFSAEIEALNTLGEWSSAVLSVATIMLPGVEVEAVEGEKKDVVSQKTMGKVAVIKEAPVIAPCPNMYPQPITERGLQMQFLQYDPEGRGWITKQDVVEIWEGSEVASLPQSRQKLDDAFKKFSMESDRVSYDEYTIIMFKLFNL